MMVVSVGFSAGAACASAWTTFQLNDTVKKEVRARTRDRLGTLFVDRPEMVLVRTHLNTARCAKEEVTIYNYNLACALDLKEKPLVGSEGRVLNEAVEYWLAFFEDVAHEVDTGRLSQHDAIHDYKNWLRCSFKSQGGPLLLYAEKRCQQGSYCGALHLADRMDRYLDREDYPKYPP